MPERNTVRPGTPRGPGSDRVYGLNAVLKDGYVHSAPRLAIEGDPRTRPSVLTQVRGQI